MLVQFCRREGLSFNAVVNLSVQAFLDQCSVRKLRLRAKLSVLLKEESGLRKTCSCMLRSGAYLPSYAEKVLKEQKGNPSAKDSPFTFSVGEGDRPLRALSRSEEKVFRKICGRREEIAREVAEIQSELLGSVKPFKLEFEGKSRSRAHDKSTKPNGGEK